jgi:hypothetical protein
VDTTAVIGHPGVMPRRDAHSHLTLSPVHHEFEALVQAAYGAGEIRHMVASTKVARAWAAAAAGRVSRGRKSGEMVAEIGDLGVFCVALGSLSILAAVPTHVRDEVRAAMNHAAPGAWLADDALVEGYDAMAWLRSVLEAADNAVLRTWTVTLLPLVVDAFARQAPRWWRVHRTGFAGVVLRRLALRVA